MFWNAIYLVNPLFTQYNTYLLPAMMWDVERNPVYQPPPDWQPPEDADESLELPKKQYCTTDEQGIQICKSLEEIVCTENDTACH